MLIRWLSRLVTPWLAALLATACSPHEFKDPTSATTEVLYVKPASLPAPAGSVPATPTAPSPGMNTGEPQQVPQQPRATSGAEKRGTGDEPAQSARSDVLELVTGHRVEGVVKQLSPTVVVIETGGQTITFERGKVKSIHLAPRP